MSLQRRRSVFSAVLYAVLLTLVACETPESVPPPEISDPSTFLGLATTTVFDLEDGLEQAELFARIAAAYLQTGDEASALAVASRALQRARAAGDGEESLRTRLNLVPVFSVVDPSTAVRILEELLTALDESPDDVSRAALIPLLIEQSLQSGESARFALREGIDLTYIILDPLRRARTLIEIASLYQRSGIGLGVTSLIQQSIPAVRSDSSPFAKAEVLSELAALAENAGEQVLASRLVEITIRELRDAEPAVAVADQRFLVRAARNFARLGERAAVDLLAGRLPAGYHRLVVEVELALLIPSPTTLGARLEELAVQAETLDDPAQQADAFLAIGEGFLASNQEDQARLAVAASQELIAGNADLQNSEPRLSRLISLSVELDEIPAVTELMNSARDPYIRGLMALMAADALTAAERLPLAEDFLVVGLRASDETSFLADSLREQLAGRFARIGSIRLAIRTVERIDEPVFVARAVVSLAAIAEPAGLTTPIHRTDLASVLQ